MRPPLFDFQNPGLDSGFAEDQKLWHYKGLVRPLPGYRGPACTDAAVLLVIRGGDRDRALKILLATLQVNCLYEMGVGRLEETTDAPFESPLEVRQAFADALESGLGFYLQPFV